MRIGLGGVLTLLSDDVRHRSRFPNQSDYPAENGLQKASRQGR